jgi:hypothetical protein
MVLRVVSERKTDLLPGIRFSFSNRAIPILGKACTRAE